MLLRDPRWQAKRLRIMERDGFRCRHCEDTTRNQQVHHTYYEHGLLPWDYPDHSLLTLCDLCHQIEEDGKQETDERIARAIRRMGADNKAIGRIALIMEEMTDCVADPAQALSHFGICCDRMWTRRARK